MPTPENLKAPFYTGHFYHMVCKSIDGLKLFNEEADYEVFLHRFKKFTGDFLDVWAYCQLSNHTHQVVKVKSADAFADFITNLPPANKTVAMLKWVEEFSISNKVGSPLPDKKVEYRGEGFLVDDLLERQMNSFLVSYANYFNNKYNRQGGLFQKPFKRLKIFDDGYLQQAVIYTHANPQKHKLTTDFSSYFYSSYHSVVNNNSYFIDTPSVQSFFGGKQNFIKRHKEQATYFYSDGSPSSSLE